MPRSSAESDFPRNFQRHLRSEQKKAVLEALRDRIAPEHTIGEVLDAAIALGWHEPLGDLSLDDLAAVLLVEGDDSDDSDEEDVEPVEVAAPSQKKGAKAKAAPAPVPAKAKPVPPPAKGKAARGKASKPEPVAKGKKTAKPQPVAKGKKASKPEPVVAKGRKAAEPVVAKGKKKKPIVVDERMSIDEAAKIFVPLITALGGATMQDLEDETGAGRRKLRFHIGQLVRHGYLDRHGMGRGTYYTVV